MSQALVCPACGAEISLEQFEQAADMLALHRLAATFGDDWGLVREYIELFRGKQALKVVKILRLAREVYEIWSRGRFIANRQEYQVGRQECREALRITCNQVSPPLSNHNYLKKVLIKASEKTSQRRERELREREEYLRAGSSPPGEDAGASSLTDKERAELSRLGRAVRQAKTLEAKAEASRRYEEYLKGAGA